MRTFWHKVNASNIECIGFNSNVPNPHENKRNNDKDKNQFQMNIDKEEEEKECARVRESGNNNP